MIWLSLEKICATQFAISTRSWPSRILNCADNKYQWICLTIILFDFETEWSFKIIMKMAFFYAKEKKHHIICCGECEGVGRGRWNHHEMGLEAMRGSLTPSDWWITSVRRGSVPHRQKRSMRRYWSYITGTVAPIGQTGSKPAAR